jgi:hypothetical protein
MQRDYPLFGRRIKLCPVPEVFFRPEEGHGASGVSYVLAPLCEGNGNVSDQALRFGLQYDPVPHLNPNRVTAIQARGIDLDHFPRQKPADRQRLKGSLCKPFLQTVDGDSKLRRKMVEGCKGCDEIRVRVQPSMDSG